MSAEFKSPKEFREVMDRVFSMMDDRTPTWGPKLRDADVPQRFEFSDVDMVVNIRAAADERGAATSTGSGPTTSTGSPRSR